MFARWDGGRGVFRCSLGAALALAGLLIAIPGPAGARPSVVREPQLGAHAVLALHSDSGTVLLARNAGEERAIASLTKLVAALVVRDQGLPLDGAMTLNRADYRVALGGSRTRLELNWTYHNRDLLRAALMSSDNRAVSALGRAVNLYAKALVQAMNAYVRGMGLEQTRFRGPVGLDHGNRSTAWDLARSKSELVLENALLRQQLIVLQRQGKCPSLTWRDRVLFVLLASKLPSWRAALLIVQPDTLLRWHRDLFRRVWRRKSKHEGKGGRQPLAEDIVILIKDMAQENRTWGAERIRGELLKLGITVAKSTIQTYINQVRGPLASKQTWSTFLRNHAQDIWAVDFLQT